MKKIKLLLKNNRCIYYIYNFIGSILLKFIGLFIKTNNKLILFNCFGGQKFDDNPKAIYEYMKNSNNYKDYQLIWALDNPKLVDGLDIEFVKNNSIKFFITALKAKYWVTNSSMERGLKFKKQNTIYINTWHGSVIKKAGNEFSGEKRKFRVSKANYIYTQSNIDINYFSKVYNYPKETFLLSGYPRNDELCNISKNEILNLKMKLNISANKKVILYAPTFREYDYDGNGCYILPPINLEKWENKLCTDYILLFRTHYEINKILNITNNDFIYNVTDYPYLNDLLKISDILISDYSSIMIDYSILERPIFCFAYDYEKYNCERGCAYDLKTELPNGIIYNEDDLLDCILSCNYEEQKIKSKKFREKRLEVYGNAASYIDKIIGKHSIKK